MRKRLPPEPYAGVATACRWAALLAAAMALLAVGLARGSTLDPRLPLAILASALALAVVTILLAMLSASVIWRTGRRGIGRSLAGLALAILVLAYPVYLLAGVPGPVTEDDLSTDPASPPPFSAASAARAARGGIDHADPSPVAREAVRRAYPTLGPVTLDRPGGSAFDLVLKTVTARGLRIVEAVPPRGKFGTGHIDAIARTRVMGLPDDVTIRIRPLEDETRVDIRAVSRFGRGDLADNAALIQGLADDLNDADS